MNTKIINKKIDTNPFKYVIVQGERLADLINFEMDSTYYGLDLAPLEYSINLVTKKDTMYSFPLSKAIDSSTGRLILAWEVTESFAAVDGEAWVEIQGYNGDDPSTIVIKFTGDPIWIKESRMASGEPQALGDAWYYQIQQLINSFVNTTFPEMLEEVNNAADRAEQAAIHPPKHKRKRNVAVMGSGCC